MVPLLDALHTRAFAGKDTYPPERVEDALAMWISWLLDDHSELRSSPALCLHSKLTLTQTSAKSTKALFRSMRPYVFAAQCYELFFAPWTRLRLPSDRQLPYVPGLFMADPNPYSRANVVPLYGRDVALAHPPLTHAAMLRFFAGTQDADEPSSAASSATPTEVAFDISTTDLRSFPRPVLVSDAHDADFARLQSCTDGTRSAGRPISAWRGVFAGCWEGTFTFLDFDAFRDMLRGETRPVYEGLFGEQAQVWKLRETFVRLKVGQAGGSGSSAAAGGTSSSSSSSNRTTAVARNYLPLAGPMTNAGFPTTLRDFDLASIARRAPGTSPEDATIDDAVGRQLEALDGYEAVPEDEVDVALAAAAPDLALLVTGVGHSAWGRFIISGHVRVWDGLVYLVKEYAPDNRGKWVYRGYVTNDDIMLGRWRDTFTHDDYVGYEGTFVLSRRS